MRRAARRPAAPLLDILALPGLEPIRQVHQLPIGRQTQFSRDGRLLFYGDDAGQVWTIDTRTWKPRRHPLAGHANPGAFALTPDDRTWRPPPGDGMTQLWDVASGHPIGGTLTGGARRPVSAAFLDGGTRLVTLDDDGRGDVWDLRPRSWQRRACAIAGRTLTRAEWQDALPDRDHAPARASR